MQAIDEYRQIIGQHKLTVEEQAEIEERADRLKALHDLTADQDPVSERIRQLAQEQRERQGDPA